jgi:predicted transcriptional regulator
LISKDRTAAAPSTKDLAVNEELIELTTDIVSAYVSNNPVPAAELSALIASVSDSLGRLGKPEEQQPELPKPPISVKKSFTPDYLISFEDGQRYKTLKRHLSIRGLTPDEYRTKWGLPRDYPMTWPENWASAASQARRSPRPKAGRPLRGSNGGPKRSAAILWAGGFSDLLTQW